MIEIETKRSAFTEEYSSTRDRLSFSRGVLILLQETRLFGPLVDQAIEDLDALIRERDQARF